MDPLKPTVCIPFTMLPESKNWPVGKAYRVKLVLRATGIDEDCAMFEVVDANSLEPMDQTKRKYLTEGGYMNG